MFLDLVDALPSSAYATATELPAWTRRHLIAHVAANADALCNLVHWAATGERTPMYLTAEDRAAGIERGIQLSEDGLRSWVRDSAVRLEAASAGLTPDQWLREVVTAQGRTVPATEIVWLRAREVLVHAVDLDQGVGFEDLPEDFLLALESDVIAKRGTVPDIEGPLPQRVAWLTGRPHTLRDAPQIGPWL